MSLGRTPPRSHLPPPSVAATGTDPVEICSICGEQLMETQDCLIINECSHCFHRVCIETSLASSSECPICKRACQLSELRKYIFLASNLPLQDTGASISGTNINTNTSITNVPHSKPPGKGKARGGQAHYNTRSRGLFHDPKTSFLNLTQENHNNTPERNQRIGNNNVSQTPVNRDNTSANFDVDYEQINRMIEQNLTRLLGNLNIIPPLGQSINPIPGNDYNSNPMAANAPAVLSPLQSVNNQNANGFSTTPSSLRLPFTSDKISAIIQSWNLKFDGSQNGLNIDEFLYRVQSLTLDTFNGDYSVICKNLQILLSGKARDWYWRYRKQVQSVLWETFCDNIRSQYRDCKTAYDIREEIRNRKQKQGETFDVFFEAVSAMMDRLSSPMSEVELIEILTRNLRPEIRQELLYVPVKTISHLRNLVQIRENFLNDDHVRRNLVGRGPNNYLPRRQIAEVDFSPDFEDTNMVVETEKSVNALQEYPHQSKCWNCDELGHHWQDCLQDRQIFCYGCGAKKVYKPNCVKCNTRKMSKNSRPIVPTEEQS